VTRPERVGRVRPVRAVGAVGAVGLRRDQVTWAGYGALSFWAWFLYGFGAILPLLRAEQGTSRTVMGLHSLALSGGALVAGSLAVRVVRRIRRRGAYLVGVATASVGVCLLTLAGSPLLSLPAVLVTGTGGSMVLNAAAASIADHHGSDGAAAFSEGNAAAAGIGLLAPLAIGGSVGLGWGWRPPALVLVPLMVWLALLVRRVPAGTPAVDGDPPVRARHRVRLPRAFWFFVLTTTTSIGIEFCCTAWSADLLHQHAGMSPAAASAGLTAVVAGMAAGRVVIGRLALRRPAAGLLVAAFVITVAGWTVTWLSTRPVLAVAGLALTGLGIAGQYPLGVSLLMRASRGHSDRATGVLSVGLSISAGGLPFLLGAIADATSTHTAFLAIPVLVAVASAALLAAVRSSAADRPAPG
jgi:predicted MFS family arabinose efflux permease